jgi:hypothetical protein
VARAAALALLAAVLALGAAAPAHAGWASPSRIAGPYSFDVLAPQLAFSSSGETAVGYGVQNEDHAITSQGFAAVSGKNGKFGGALRVPDSQEVLAVAFDGTDPVLLIGASQGPRPCCSFARLVRISGGKLQGARTVIRGLSGATDGQLVALGGGRMLSVAATAEAVWEQQGKDSTPPTPAVGAARRLTPKGAGPQTLSAVILRGGRTVVAWTAAALTPAPTVAPATIMSADGTANRAPRRPHIAVRVATGHQIDELALGRSGGSATAGWIESFTDTAGKPHSLAAVADLGRNVHRRSFEVPGMLASGLSLATSPSGAQVLSWKLCELVGSCRVEAVVKDGGGTFGSPMTLGRIDASQAPAAAISNSGTALVGWIDGGRVFAAARARRARRFVPPHLVSGTDSAMDLTLGFGPGKTAMAAWSQGTFTETLMGAVFDGP